MKHFQKPLSAAALLLAASCSVKEDRIQCTAPVTVAVSTFSISQEDIPLTKAAQNVADYTDVKSITLAFFSSDGTEQYKATQLRPDATTYDTFGTFSLSLPYGSYKMVVIAHEGDFPITLGGLAEANFGSEKPKDTFLYSQDVTIENSNPVNLSATLQRIITRLILESTEPKPANVKNVRITLSKGGTSFSPITGYSSTNAGFANTFSLEAAAAGVSKLRTTFFIGALEENLDVKAEVLDASGAILNTIQVPAAPFKRNRATFLKGSLYSTSCTGSFQVETAFETDYHMDF